MITAEQENEIRLWIEHKRPSAECDCGVTKWTIGDSLVAPVEYHDGHTPPDRLVPLVMLVCNNCAHVELFHAVSMGVALLG